ncbi:hypothetical protein [Arthrobacter sp. NPDC057009]|uniref:hypothetical protein n=1 Tax=Arthrobacter sp. NPDC057009 TaxID=3345996 RepID=UPI0036401C6D
MTEVLEPTSVKSKDFAPGMVFEEFPAGFAVELPETPVHCGTGMTLASGPILPRLPWAVEEPANAEWVCACGFRMAAATTEETDPLNAVRLMSARLESLRWELDHAQEILADAVRKAIRCGAGPASLRDAANMDDAELESLLGQGS